jgi:hypothetical protein
MKEVSDTDGSVSEVSVSEVSAVAVVVTSVTVVSDAVVADVSAGVHEAADKAIEEAAKRASILKIFFLFI